MSDKQLKTKAWQDIIAHHRAIGAPCHLCGNPIPLGLPRHHPLGLSIDHLTPRSKGGSNDLTNSAPSHLACNSSRHDKDLTPDVYARCRALYDELTAKPVRADLTHPLAWYA